MTLLEVDDGNRPRTKHEVALQRRQSALDLGCVGPRNPGVPIEWITSILKLRLELTGSSDQRNTALKRSDPFQIDRCKLEAT
jgi:hypothetical protein